MATQPPPPPVYSANNPNQPPPAGGYTQPPPAGGYGPPPPAGGYAQPPPPQYGQQGQTVIIAQPSTTVFGGNPYGPSPVTMTCQYCQSHITTSTSKHCGGSVWIVAGIICFIGLFIPFVWLGCCLIPFCIPSLYDTSHTCPNCMRKVGYYSAGNM